jgi:uncharacterized flavoprotein (TIGR03862 family)
MKKQISIIGGGPSALVLAAFIDESKYSVTIYEKNKSVGRKFLVAGDGGFNLTHSESINEFVENYTPSGFLKEALLAFSNTDLQSWLNEIGVPTFIGSSKRVYPEEGIKPIEVLNAILNKLKQKKVNFKFEYNWVGWNDLDQPIFDNKEVLETEFIVFSLGGGSWKVTGSDGGWLNKFKDYGVLVENFKPSNCAYKVSWNPDFIKKCQGEPLKNIAITCSGKRKKGEVVITKFGLEGNAIYALSPQIRAELIQNSVSEIEIDLKPNLRFDTVLNKIKASKYKKTTEVLRKDLKLSTTQLGLVKAYISKEAFLNPELLAQNIKNLKLELIGAEVLDKAISSVGGVSLKAVNSNFELKSIPNQYCIGEMLDWDAPTGGYLLQACFSMGVSLANQFNSASRENTY